MVQSLPSPSFKEVPEKELLYEVLSEMHQTIYLDCYYERATRVQEIITKWNERSQEIAKENFNGL